MPLYEFSCPKCKKSFDEFMGMNDKHEAKCKCGTKAERIWSFGGLVTDTSFPLTGVKDSRLDNEVIQGRKHFKQKCEEKGYMEIDMADVN